MLRSKQLNAARMLAKPRKNAADVAQPEIRAHGSAGGLAAVPPSMDLVGPVIQWMWDRENLTTCV